MPVQTPHPDYSHRKTDWDKIRCFAEGARAVKKQGEVFLPKIKGWTQEEYDAYKARAEVFGAVDRTIDGLDGAIFRKAPQIELPSKDDPIEQDVTLSGKTLIEWIRDVCREVITVGRLGVLVDFTGTAAQANPTARPLASQENRAYAVTYSAEQIINWEQEVIDGQSKLTLVVLEEKTWGKSATDPFVMVPTVRYRVLRLVDGVYRVEIWTRKVAVQSTSGTGTAKESDEFEKTAEAVPLRRGAPLESIPFFFFGVSGQSVSPEKPPLLDIADLCVLHYMTSADYAHGLHWVALPTPWATGVREKEKLGIGPQTMIALEDHEAKLGMLEFSGAGLNAIKERLEGLEGKMATLGARILEEQKKQAESGEALKLRQAGDTSVLAGISDAVSRAAEAVVKRMLWWNGTETEEPDVSIALNMEFLGVSMDPQMITALMAAWQSGAISKETFIWNLKKGEMLPEERTVEDELARTETEAPPGMPSKQAPQGGKGAE